MRSGELDQRVTFKRLVQGQDELGQPINEVQELATVWASVTPLNGREYFSAAAAQSEVTTKIRVRYLPGLTSADTVTHEGTDYNIVSVINHQSANSELVLMCRG